MSVVRWGVSEESLLCTGSDTKHTKESSGSPAWKHNSVNIFLIILPWIENPSLKEVLSCQMCLINVWQQRERICLTLSRNSSGCSCSSSSRSDACWGVDLCFRVMYLRVCRWIVTLFLLSPSLLSNAPPAAPSLSALLSSWPPSVLTDFKNSLCYNVSSNLLHHPSLCDHTE